MLLQQWFTSKNKLFHNTAEASEIEKDKIAVDPLIEDLKTKHPDWTVTLVTSDEAAKIKEELKKTVKIVPF
ncbi:hypothetical protein [Lysinibacillus fusiformis]|uniref:hypothetical protein n=1 Tax=Lysinibacillus fusiformis TaxID=28031 RepID=UPI0035575545